MNPYDLSTRELLNKFMNACARAGTSNSGLVISYSAGSDLAHAHYLRGAVEARIDHVAPPAKIGAKVKPNKKEIGPVDCDRRHSMGVRKLPNKLTVRKVYYLGHKQWAYIFAEEIKNVTAWEDGEYDQDTNRSWLVPLRFNAEDFDLVEEPAPAPTR